MKQLLDKCKGVIAILLFSSCVHQMEISRQAVREVDELAKGKSFWLKQSLFAGTFYDDDRYFLLNPRPFDEIDYVKMPDGATVLPPAATHIIPVGTKVTVSAVEWPDWQNYLNRPIFTPRHLIWVKMKVAKERGQVSLMHDKTFIMLVPFEGGHTELFAGWFKGIFSDKDTNPWLLRHKPEITKAILEKKAVAGMSKEALIASMGDPNTWSREFSDEAAKTIKEIANYEKQVVVIENGVVSKIQALTPSTPAQFHSADLSRSE